MRLFRFLIAIVIIGLCALPLNSQEVRASDEDVFISSADDGFLSCYDTVYADARDPSEWDNVTANYSNVSFKVGQAFDGTNYYIYRGALFFDTSSLPTEIEITDVTLSLWAREINNDDSDSLYVVEAGDQYQPPVYTGYILFGTDVFSTETTFASFSTSDYTDVSFTASGRDLIKTGDYTIIGLRAYDDITNDDPSGTVDTYLDIWSGDSVHPPKLTVTYDTVDLSSPNILNVRHTAIFTGYAETGDQLYVFGSDIRYTDTPTLLPSEYFAVQLQYGSSVVAQSPVRRWNYAPMSIYLSAENALTWGESYDLVITGLDTKFDTPPEYTHTIVAEDWKGEARNSTFFRQWLYITSSYMAMVDGFGYLGYRDDANKSLLNSEASAIYEEGIPYITRIYQDMFTDAGLPLPDEEDTTTDTESTGMFNQWGTYWSGVWNGIGGSFGVSGYWIVSLFFVGLSVGSVFLLRRHVATPLSYLAVLPIMGVAMLVGMPLQYAVVVCVLAIIYFAWNVIPRGTT